jgi:hypothetical protein
MSDIIHFDSIYSNYTLPANDPFNAKFDLSTALQNVDTISLKSAEIPINFYNIRSGSTMNQIILTTNLSNTYTVSITAGNYTTVASLLTAINNAFIGIVPSTTVTFATSGNKINVSATSSSITSFSLTDTILSKNILGFRNTTFSGLNTTGSVDYVLNVDNYVNMYLYNVASENCSANGRVFCSFKIPLNGTYGIIYYYSENASFKQHIKLLGGAQTIQYIQAIIYDRFGNQLLSNNSDYSFSLEIVRAR